jgi:ABC-type transport system substrate-binding protein
MTIGVACGETETVIQTVVVEKSVPGETVIQTVVVEKEVEIAGETVVQTVVVEKEVAGETVIQTVVVEKQVEVQGQTVVQTVVVEKEVEKEVIKEVEKEVQVVVTATPEPAMMMETPTFKGTLRLGEILIDPPVFLPSKQGTGNAQLLIFWGFFEPLMWAQHSGPPNLNLDEATYTEGIAESWEVAADTSSVTFKIRDGVKFHTDWNGNDWGEVDAYDVEWSYGDALREGSINQRAQGINRFVSGFEAIDDMTIRMNVKDNSLDPRWYHVISNTTLGSPVMVPKELYEELGEEGANLTPVGTGTFRVTEWVTDSNVRGEPVEGHYRKQPSVASYEIILMPEPLARIAALQTGLIHVAQVPLKLIKNTVANIDGARPQVVGPPINQVVMFAGNYWAETDQNGEDIYRKRPGFKPDDEHPWIGDPDDPASMERANKVRRALRLGIDRQTIVDEIQSGIGKPLTNAMNAFPGDPHWLDEFDVPYDSDQAKALLAEAGFPNCFPFKYHVAPGKEWDAEVGGAVAQYWRELGCEVTVDATDYGAARPRLVNRQKEIPWMIQAGTNARPDVFFGSVYRPTAGFNYGIELPDDITAISVRNLDLASTTVETRIANSVEWWTYVNNWNLVASVSTLPYSMVLRPEIIEYSPYMNTGPEFVAPETVVMSGE